MHTEHIFSSSDEDSTSQRSTSDIYLTYNYGDQLETISQLMVRPNEPSDRVEVTIPTCDCELLGPSISNASDCRSTFGKKFMQLFRGNNKVIIPTGTSTKKRMFIQFFLKLLRKKSVDETLTQQMADTLLLPSLHRQFEFMSNPRQKQEN